MYSRARPGNGAPRRRLDVLRKRCLERAQQKRQELLSQRRLSGVEDALQMADTVGHWREIVQAELFAVARPSRGAPSVVAWSEADEARLQQHLGPDGYLELMTATEEALLQELDADLAGLSNGGLDPDGSAREYESFLAQEDALMAARAEETVASTSADGSVLCPLCLRSSLCMLADGTTIVCGRAAADGGGCTLRLDSRGQPAPLELLRERMCLLLNEHGNRCRGCAYGRLATPQEQAAGAAAILLLTCVQCGMDAPVV